MVRVDADIINQLHKGCCERVREKNGGKLVTSIYVDN